MPCGSDSRNPSLVDTLTRTQRFLPAADSAPLPSAGLWAIWGTRVPPRDDELRGWHEPTPAAALRFHFESSCWERQRYGLWRPALAVMGDRILCVTSIGYVTWFEDAEKLERERTACGFKILVWLFTIKIPNSSHFHCGLSASPTTQKLRQTLGNGIFILLLEASFERVHRWVVIVGRVKRILQLFSVSKLNFWAKSEETTAFRGSDSLKMFWFCCSRLVELLNSKSTSVRTKHLQTSATS